MRQSTQAVEIKKGPASAGHVDAGRAATGLAEAGLATTSLAGAGVSIARRRRVEAVVETLSNLRSPGESLAELAHDTRNMVTALGLYCDLLEEPGVLTPSFQHYAAELRLVATASRRLVEKMLALDARQGPDSSLISDLGAIPTETEPLIASRLEQARRWDLLPPEPIDNLAGEMLANRNLLSALAGPSIALTVDVEGGALPVLLTGEDLTRILVNLVKNAAEALPTAGRIALNLHEFHAATKLPPWLLLTIEDNGTGIPVEALEKIFDSGYTTRQSGAPTPGGPGSWPACHRGLGLSITRSIVEGAGGHIHAANRSPYGACFTIELPARTR
jgi:signal transduction histidine kinase